MAMTIMYVDKEGKEYLVAAVIDEILGDNNVRIPEEEYDYVLTDSYIIVAGREEQMLDKKDVAEYMAEIVAKILVKHPESIKHLVKLLAKKQPELLENLRKALEAAKK